MYTRIKKRLSLAGFAGFIGFLGIRYFFSGEPSDLFLFTYLAFFSFWIMGGLRYEIEDERYKENNLKAGAVALFVAMGFIFLIGFVYSNYSLPQEFVAGGCALGWIVT